MILGLKLFLVILGAVLGSLFGVWTVWPETSSPGFFLLCAPGMFLLDIVGLVPVTRVGIIVPHFRELAVANAVVYGALLTLFVSLACFRDRLSIVLFGTVPKLRRRRLPVVLAVLVALPFSMVTMIPASILAAACRDTLASVDSLPRPMLQVFTIVGWTAFVFFGAYLPGRSIYHSIRWKVFKGPSMNCFFCGYNLTGNISGVCPECGQPIPTDPDSKPEGADR